VGTWRWGINFRFLASQVRMRHSAASPEGLEEMFFEKIASKFNSLHVRMLFIK
jgi:hypothetical protein